MGAMYGSDHTNGEATHGYSAHLQPSSTNGKGGATLAGVVLLDNAAPEADMQRVAARSDTLETAFAFPLEGQNTVVGARPLFFRQSRKYPSADMRHCTRGRLEQRHGAGDYNLDFEQRFDQRSIRADIG